MTDRLVTRSMYREAYGISDETVRCAKLRISSINLPYEQYLCELIDIPCFRV